MNHSWKKKKTDAPTSRSTRICGDILVLLSAEDVTNNVRIQINKSYAHKNDIIKAIKHEFR